MAMAFLFHLDLPANPGLLPTLHQVAEHIARFCGWDAREARGCADAVGHAASAVLVAEGASVHFDQDAQQLVVEVHGPAGEPPPATAWFDSVSTEVRDGRSVRRMVRRLPPARP